ncbi:60S ribosomal protein L31 [Dionaea muscipula]
MVEKATGIKKEVVTREYTINLHKRLHGCTFKKKAPKAIKEIRKFVEKEMGTKDVRVDVKLNKQIWSRGIRGVPRRIRVRVARNRNDDEDAKEELYSLVTVAEIPAEGLKGLGGLSPFAPDQRIKIPHHTKPPAMHQWHALGYQHVKSNVCIILENGLLYQSS